MRNFSLHLQNFKYEARKLNHSPFLVVSIPFPTRTNSNASRPPPPPFPTSLLFVSLGREERQDQVIKVADGYVGSEYQRPNRLTRLTIHCCSLLKYGSALLIS